MKKIAIASLIALAVTTASALELGVNTTRSYVGENNTGFGVSVGQQYGKVGVSANFDRFTRGTEDQDRLSLNGSYNLLTVGTATVAATAGVAHLNNKVSGDGYALTVGAGVSVPVTKQVSVGLGVARQYGQDRVQAFDGNTVTAGLKFRF